MLASNAKDTAEVIVEFCEDKGLPFRKAFSSEHLTRLFEKYKIDFRDRIMPPDVTLMAFCSQLIDKDRSCKEAVSRINHDRDIQGLAKASSSTSAHCQSRAKLPLGLIRDLARDTARFLEEESDGSWFWHERHLKIIDGSTLSMPDTAANQDRWPQHGKQQEGVGFPIMRVVAVTSYATGGILDFAYGPWRGKETGEHALARQVLDSLKNRDVLLADRYYCSYFFIASLREKDVDLVTRIHGARDYDFRSGRKLGIGDHVVELQKPPKPCWMDKTEYDSIPSTLTVREVKVDGSGEEEIVVVTTLIDPVKYSRSELASVYKKRWHIELDLRSIKSVMGMDILSCKTPDMIEKEVWTYILSYNLVRQLICQAASKHKIEPRTISFTGALQTFNVYQAGFRFCDAETNRRMYESMLDLIASHRIGNRPGRKEPKAVKRRPKAYAKLTVPREEWR